MSFPPPQALSYPGIEPASPALQADSLPLSHWGNPMCLLLYICYYIYYIFIINHLLCLTYKFNFIIGFVYRKKTAYMGFGIICSFRHSLGVLECILHGQGGWFYFLSKAHHSLLALGILETSSVLYLGGILNSKITDKKCKNVALNSPSKGYLFTVEELKQEGRE